MNGTIDVYNQCFGPGDCTALVNFWRSLSNLTINVAGKEGCQSGEFWATSQAAPMRRVHVNGFTTLMDYCTGPSFASGGFIADSQFSGSTVVNGSQQQYLVRNSSVDGWSNGVWNQVFAGVAGRAARSRSRTRRTRRSTPTRRRARSRSSTSTRTSTSTSSSPTRASTRPGTTWADGQTPGHSIPIESFFIAKPTDSVQSINNALSRGKNLLFTPGVYDVDKTIKVKRADTIVLGLGMATLTAQNGVVPMTVADVKGVEIAGLIFDAGARNSPALLQFGDLHRRRRPGARARRVARRERPERAPRRVLPHRRPARRQGARRASWSAATTRSSTTSGPGAPTTATASAGRRNTADTGVVVTGDNVVATGLFVEHYQKYNVFWAGENGKTIMFQNEMPYDPPNQAAWQHNGVLGLGRLQGRRLGQDPRGLGSRELLLLQRGSRRSTRAARSRCP